MKKVIITGAAGGIGQALTNRLLKAGYQVIAVDNNKDKLGIFLPIQILHSLALM
ncbi:SDR family NAD(P)-dependent oxidoreductase [Enterococcus faecium]|nr:SDR family NAD(P)-dependent oxidoreductase [Enterococcus faecium]